MLSDGMPEQAWRPYTFSHGRKKFSEWKFLFLTWKMISLGMVSSIARHQPHSIHRNSQEGPRRQGPLFLAYLVILCIEKRRPKQKYCCSPKVKHFDPPQIFAPVKVLGWLRQGLNYVFCCMLHTLSLSVLSELFVKVPFLSLVFQVKPFRSLIKT